MTFWYVECPVCEFDEVTATRNIRSCTLCYGDGHYTLMHILREATAEDKVEGYDARKDARHANFG